MEHLNYQPPNMPQPFEQSPQEDPEAVIRTIMQQVAVMGRNDHEMSSFADILRRYRSTDPGEHIDGAQAIAEARAIMEGKQDYN